ncbi:hypothetical protein D3C75_1307380 [compost metagenome]
MPYRVRSKNRNKPMISANDTAITHRVWLLISTGPISRPCSEKGSVRAPSGPNSNRPMPTMLTCTAMETISSTSELAAAIGWNTRR